MKLFLLCIFFEILTTASVLASANITYYEERTIQEINKIRNDYRLKPLKTWKQLSICAREHSSNMAAGTVPFGHEGFEERAKRMQKIGNLAAFGENVAYNFHYEDPVKAAVEGWMKSPPHCKNILGDYDETGVGIAITQEGKFYVTQLFAKRR